MHTAEPRERQLQPPHGRQETAAEDTARQNEIQRRLEDRARSEANTGHRRFSDWLCDTYDVYDLKDIVVHLIDATEDTIDFAKRQADGLAADYVNWRVRGASLHEIADIDEQIVAEREEI